MGAGGCLSFCLSVVRCPAGQLTLGFWGMVVNGWDGVMAESNAAATAVCSVTVTVTNLRSGDGQLCFSIFGGAEGFPGESERAIARGFVDATDPTYTFSGLRPGTYAVALFHDENGDGILNKNLLGMPQEGFGFSNNPLVLIGAPSFRAAAFELRSSHSEVLVKLKYF